MVEGSFPERKQVISLPENTSVLLASGDLRIAANQNCWQVQERMEMKLIEAFRREGLEIVRGHEYDPVEKHGFISSQRMGIEVLKKILRMLG
jgi:hypothetical protein